MSEDWKNFTQNSYKRIIKEILKKFKISLISSNNSLIKDYICILRHDIDMSPERALKLAEIEFDLGAKSTFYLLFNSRFYNLFQPSTLKTVDKILKLEHEIGFHFDVATAFEPQNINCVIDTLHNHAKILSNLIGMEINSFTIHNPGEKGKITLDNEYYSDLKNASSSKFVNKFAYCSDSNGVWGSNNIKSLLKDAGVKKLYVLTHPVWWTKEIISPREKIKLCIQDRSKNTLEEYDEDLKRQNRPNI